LPGPSFCLFLSRGYVSSIFFKTGRDRTPSPYPLSSLSPCLRIFPSLKAGTKNFESPSFELVRPFHPQVSPWREVSCPPSNSQCCIRGHPIFIHPSPVLSSSLLSRYRPNAASRFLTPWKNIEYRFLLAGLTSTFPAQFLFAAQMVRTPLMFRPPPWCRRHPVSFFHFCPAPAARKLPFLCPLANPFFFDSLPRSPLPIEDNSYTPFCKRATQLVPLAPTFLCPFCSIGRQGCSL